MTTWILVSDASRGTLFSAELREDDWSLVTAFEHPEGRERSSEIKPSSPPGRTHQSKVAGTQRTSLDPHTSPKEVETERFAQQLSFDVASLQKAERKALFEHLGASALPFVQAAWVADFLPRARFALDTLFGSSPRFECGAGAEDEDLMAAIEELIRVVPQLQVLDPVTTELVRLLGARRHRCRLCQSLRSRSALVAGADDALFEAVDRHETSDLSEARKAALAFVEAMLTTPGQIGDRAEALHAHYEPAACVEIVLDVTRNATNKVAVGLGADAPHVESGYEIYDVGPDGELLFGLDPP